jgi:hypothetical protein
MVRFPFSPFTYRIHICGRNIQTCAEESNHVIESREASSTQDEIRKNLLFGLIQCGKGESTGILKGVG